MKVGTLRALQGLEEGDTMLNIVVENIGGVALVQCRGRIVNSESAFGLRDAVLSQGNSRIIVVDLSEVNAIEGGGLGMLAYVQRWAYAHNIKLKLFNPSSIVHDRLERTFLPQLEIATTDEMIALLDQVDDGRVSRRL
jgi:anti-anti-sigma regulatory factor